MGKAKILKTQGSFRWKTERKPYLGAALPDWLLKKLFEYFLTLVCQTQNEDHGAAQLYPRLISLAKGLIHSLKIIIFNSVLQRERSGKKQAPLAGRT